jgi:hypothetical protein
VLDLCLNLLDALDIKAGLLLDLGKRLLGDQSQLRLRLASGNLDV